MKKLVNPIAWICYSIIILSPLLTKGSIYKHIVGYDQPRSDFGDYTALVNKLANGGQVQDWLYPARAILAYPLNWLNKATGINIDTMYIWFCFLGLLATSFVIYKVIMHFTGRQSAWLAVLIGIFCSTGILAMFRFGMIMSIINVYIFLLSAVVFGVSWLTDKKKWQLICCIVSIILFSSFHLTALYFPYIALFLIAITLAIGITKKVKVTSPVLLLSGLLLINLITSYFSFPDSMVILNGMAGKNTASVLTNGSSVYLSNSPLSLLFFSLNYLSISTFGLAILAAVGIVKYNIITSKKLQVFLVTLLGIAIVLGIGTFAPFSPEPVRTATDFASILAIIIAIMIGLLMNRKGRIWLKVPVAMLIAIGVITNISIWLS